MLALAFSLAPPLVLVVSARAIDWRKLSQRQVWVLGTLLVGRSVTRLLALQFTLAMMVQLVDLAVPLLTPLLAWKWLHERLPTGTLPAILLTSLGSYLGVTVHPMMMTLPNGSNDLIGIGFALRSAILMPFAVVYTRYLMS